MVKLISSNPGKAHRIKLMVNALGADFEVKSEELLEIQTLDMEELITIKLKDAFSKIGEPLFVNDSSWNIPALNGFPGPYMKYIGYWFSSEDFLSLMKNKKDKKIYLVDYFGCIDKNENIEIFKAEFDAEIIDEPRGGGHPINRIVYYKEVGKTISEFTDSDRKAVFESNRIWKDLADWINRNT